VWAIALIAGLAVARPLMIVVMARCGHGELLMLFGILMTAAGYSSFELVGLKGDLGALVFGMLVAAHPKASELADTLLGFKDLFLIGFFLDIGISGTPTPAAVGIAVLLALAMPLKTVLFFGVLSRFKLRARTSLLAALSLSNYSEFGLIVGSIAVAGGWIARDWLTIMAIALSMTFIIAAPVNAVAHAAYARFSERLKRFETAERLPGEGPIHLGPARMVIIGMGGVGSAAYDEMRRRHGTVITGIDFCADTVESHCRIGRNVVHGDASDSDFWERLAPALGRVELIMLALPDPKAAAFAAGQLADRGYRGQVTASVRYEDEIPILQEAGIDAVYSLYEEAGVGFADHVCVHLAQCGTGNTIDQS
jgi:hypothetical protein